ncbi:hypothetical protein ES703_14541 [subsurface metagenome]
MIERLTPGEYEKRQISDLPAPEAWLNKELKEQAEERAYIYGDPPEEPENEKPPVQYIPVGVENAEKVIPWGLIGVISIVGIIALGIVAIVAVKK